MPLDMIRAVEALLTINPFIMKINFKEVDCLEKGLRKILKKNRCLSKKEKRCLWKASRFFEHLEENKKRKKGFFSRLCLRIFKLLLKLM